jgi:hypothetical protein
MAQVTKVTITIETTNAAFWDGSFEEEYLHVLEQARLIDGMKLKDSNGNTVGKVDIETE